MPPRFSRFRISGVFVLVASLAGGASAQETSRVACRDGRIAEILVDPRPIFDPTAPGAGNRSLHGQFGWLFRLADRVHTETKPDVIRREVLFREGDCYDPAVLKDSERLLRNTPFIADANIQGERLPGGDWRVAVVTRDEWGKRIEARTSTRRGFRVSGLKVSEANLMGTGQEVEAYYRAALDEESYGVGYSTPQLFRTPLDAEFLLGRTLDGGFLLSETVTYPFRGEAGRWAWREHFSHEDRYFSFLVNRDGEKAHVLFPELRRRMDVGGVYRLGSRGNLTLFGAALTGEWTEYPQGVRYENSDGRLVQKDGALDSVTAELDSVSTVRAMLLAGQRNVFFVRRNSLDAVHAAEDVRLGIEGEVGIGRSLPRISSDNDLAVQVGFFAAGEPAPNLLSGARLALEGRRDFNDSDPGDPAWTNIFTQLDAWTYWSVAPRHTLVAALSAAGGWNTTVPFQLTLGGASGLRGYPAYLVPGGRRVVGSLEARSYLGWPYPELFDLGTVAFVDVGRSWRAEDPYGIDTGFQASVGAGLRAAFPAGSRRTYRLDVGIPLTHDFGAGGVQVTVGVGQAIGRARRISDPQIARSSRRAISASLFNFPD